MWASNPGTPEAQTRSTPQQGFQEMKIKCGHMVNPHPQDRDVCTTRLQADAGTSYLLQAKEKSSRQKSAANTLTLDAWTQSWKKTDFDILAPCVAFCHGPWRTGSVGALLCARCVLCPPGRLWLSLHLILWPLPLLSRAATSRHSLLV